MAGPGCASVVESELCKRNDEGFKKLVLSKVAGFVCRWRCAAGKRTLLGTLEKRTLHTH